MEGQIFDDIFDSFARQLGLFAVRDAAHEKGQELLQRGIVHPVDVRDLDHGEVKRGAADSHGPILFPFFVDFFTFHFRVDETRLDFFAPRFRVIQDLHELVVVKKVSRGRRQSVE